MEQTRWDLHSRWFCDIKDQEWKAKLEDGTVIKRGDLVHVKMNNGTRMGTVKQVAGFGWKEDRPVVSILFPGRSKGIKVHINDVLKKV